jgi:predicted dehydrogenase
MPRSESSLGVGLIGCGAIGQIHADGLAKLVADGVITAVAAADPSPEGRGAVERNCHFERLSADPQSVIDDPSVEAVVIAAPTPAHGPLVRAALAAAKPLLCEKPLATTFNEVQKLCDDVSASRLVAQVGFHSRFHPLFNQLRDLVTTGDLGPPMSYLLRDDQFFPSGDFVEGHSSWRHDASLAGGGALLEHSIHAADLLIWIFGPVRRVFCCTRHSFGYGVEDSAVLTVEHDSGVIGSLVSVFNGVVGREERRVEVFFEQGTVELTSDFIVGAREDRFLVHQPGQPAANLDLAMLSTEYFDGLGLPRHDFVFYQYPADRAWVLAVLGGRAASPSFADALVAHGLVEAAYRSAAGGHPVELNGEWTTSGSVAAPGG